MLNKEASGSRVTELSNRGGGVVGVGGDRNHQEVWAAVVEKYLWPETKARPDHKLAWRLECTTAPLWVSASLLHAKSMGTDFPDPWGSGQEEWVINNLLPEEK